MRVEALIRKLQEMDPDADVAFGVPVGCEEGATLEASEVHVSTDKKLVLLTARSGREIDLNDYTF